MLRRLFRWAFGLDTTNELLFRNIATHGERLVALEERLAAAAEDRELKLEETEPPTLKDPNDLVEWIHAYRPCPLEDWLTIPLEARRAMTHAGAELTRTVLLELAWMIHNPSFVADQLGIGPDEFEQREETDQARAMRELAERMRSSPGEPGTPKDIPRTNKHTPPPSFGGIGERAAAAARRNYEASKPQRSLLGLELTPREGLEDHLQELRSLNEKTFGKLPPRPKVDPAAHLRVDSSESELGLELENKTPRPAHRGSAP